MSRLPNSNDPLEQMMNTVLEGFRQTSKAIHDLRAEQEELKQNQKNQAQAAYHGMTGSGKSRYVSQLVSLEEQVNPYVARTRVAETLDVSRSRVSQLVNSDKNRKNGK